jgi:hypothetical protein
VYEFHVNRISSFRYTSNWDFFFKFQDVCDRFVESSPSVYTPGNVGRVGIAVINSSHHFAVHKSSSLGC